MEGNPVTDDYRRIADECLRHAAERSDQSDKRRWLELAVSGFP